MNSMTRRERLEAVFSGQPVDRLPWSPLVDGYFGNSLPQQGFDTDIIAAMKYIGNDIMERHVAGAIYHLENVECKTFRNGNRSRVEYITPVGTIYEEREQTPTTEYIRKHYLTDVNDIKVLQYIAEHTTFTPNIADFIEREKYIGDNGMATLSLTTTPIQECLQHFCGVQETVFLLADYPDEMEALFQAMHERNKRQCYTLCEYPTSVVFQYEDTSTTVMNRVMLEKYELPCVNDYAEIFHQNGKKYITHMCGKLNGFKESIAMAKMDGIDSVCPPTTGDLSAWDAKQAFGNKILIGGIEPPSLLTMTLRETLETVVEILNKVENKQGFVLSTGDAVPYGTPIRNLLGITKLIERLGEQSLGTDISCDVIDEVIESME